MNLLMIALDNGRWGQARLAQPLREAGFAVAALCPPGIPLAHSDHIERHFTLSSERSSRVIERELAAAMRLWRPRLLIPGDERGVACLHDILRRAEAGRPVALDDASLATLRISLGNPASFNAALLKSETLALARRLGVPTPQSMTVPNAEAALLAARALGYPVALKQSFSWAGQGVALCADEAALRLAAAQAFSRPSTPWRQLAKRLLHRDWYPTSAAVDVQKAVAGSPAFWCGVAIAGRVAGGFAGLVRQTSSATGPSSVIRIAHHAGMHAAAQRMTAAMGLTGFIGFDFMLEHGTGRALLLECNPRPVPACHLGARIGVDLCQALAAALRGEVLPHAHARTEELVALFPQEWQRDPRALAAFEGHIDIPTGDPGLMRLIAALHPGSAAMMPLPPAPVTAAAHRPGHPARLGARLLAQLSGLGKPRSQASFLR